MTNVPVKGMKMYTEMYTHGQRHAQMKAEKGAVLPGQRLPAKP